MSDKAEEHGLIAVMLGSSITKCPIPYRSQTKTFQLFNKSSISVDIMDGIGLLDPETFLTPKYNADDTEYEEIFEINNGELIGEDIDPDLVANAIQVFIHLNRNISYLYASSVVELDILFGVLNDELYLTDVLSCKICHQNLYDLLLTVPDGVDCLAEYIALCISYNPYEVKCCDMSGCKEEPKIQATLGAIIKYHLSYLFYDCDIELLEKFVKRSIQELKPNVLRKTVQFCQKCYTNWQLFEMQMLKMKSQCRESKTQIPTAHKKSMGSTMQGTTVLHKKKSKKNTFQSTGTTIARMSLNVKKSHHSSELLSKTSLLNQTGMRKSYSRSENLAKTVYMPKTKKF